MSPVFSIADTSDRRDAHYTGFCGKAPDFLRQNTDYVRHSSASVGALRTPRTQHGNPIWCLPLSLAADKDFFPKKNSNSSGTVAELDKWESIKLKSF